MTAPDGADMSDRRVLLTPSQRDVLSTPTRGLEEGRPRERAYEEKSRVRASLPNLSSDVDALLQGDHDDLYLEIFDALLTDAGRDVLAESESPIVDEIREAVCSE